MKIKKSSPSDIRKVFSQIEQKIQNVDSTLRNTHEIPRDSTMMKGGSKIYSTQEEAQEAMDNPDIPFAEQHIQDLVDRIIRR